MNRAQRRQLAKAGIVPETLPRVQSISYTKKQLAQVADESLQYTWSAFMAGLGLFLLERGKSEKKIENFIIDLQSYITERFNEGADGAGLIAELEERTGIGLRTGG